MSPAKVIARLRRLAEDWRREEARLCEQFGDVIAPQSMRARQIKDAQAIDAAVEMIERLDAAEAEVVEQARLNGMGAEREAALMAKLCAAEAAAERLRGELTAAHAQALIGIEWRELSRAQKAEIDRMRQQEPIGWFARVDGDGVQARRHSARAAVCPPRRTAGAEHSVH